MRRREQPPLTHLTRCSHAGFVLVVPLLLVVFMVYRFSSSDMASSLLFLPQTRSLVSTIQRERVLGHGSGSHGIVARAEIRALRTPQVRTQKLGSVFVSTRGSGFSSEAVRLRGAMRHIAPVRADADVTMKTTERLPGRLQTNFEALRFTNYANWVVPGTSPITTRLL